MALPVLQGDMFECLPATVLPLPFQVFTHGFICALVYVLQDDVFECEEQECQALTPIFQPLYYNLIQVLLQKVQYPEEQEFESWTKGEQYWQPTASLLLTPVSFKNKFSKLIVEKQYSCTVKVPIFGLISKAACSHFSDLTAV